MTVTLYVKKLSNVTAGERERVREGMGKREKG
jgi:hypothetical protein